MPTCCAPRCTRTTRAAKLCQRHYQNLSRYGHVLAVREMTIPEYLEHVGFTRTPRGCLEWNGPKNENGYGLVNLLRQGLVNARAHRVVWELHRGPLAPGVELRHECDNPPCAELSHLAPGTHADNMRDMKERGRTWSAGRTTCSAGHDLTLPGATKEYADGGRCVLCRRSRANRYKRVRSSAKRAG